MRCIIVDDEPIAREGMELNIAEVPKLKLLESFGTAIKASEYLKSHEVDLIFLDIQMPGITGIEFLRMMPLNALVILTTAYSEYALEAYELEVVDYLLKPIKIERFKSAVERAQKLHQLLSTKEEQVIESVEDEFIYIRANREYVKLMFEDVLFIKGMKDYVMIKTKSSSFMTAMNIKTIHAQLPKKLFSRVSRSYIISANKAEKMDRDYIYIGGHEIPVGSSYKEEYVNRFIKPRLIGRKSKED